MYNVGGEQQKNGRKENKMKMIYYTDNKKHTIRFMNYLMVTKNGIIISRNSAEKLINNSVFSWNDLFDF